MHNRFKLSFAGMASLTIGGGGSADLLSFTIHNDNYIGESSWQLIDSNSQVLASMAVNSSNLQIMTSQSSIYAIDFGWWGSSVNMSGYRTEFQMELEVGEYTVLMQDTWGDGWVWNNATGLDAYMVEGRLSKGNTATFSFTSGNSSSGDFTVVPAPAAFALLGLASTPRKRRSRALQRLG